MRTLGENLNLFKKVTRLSMALVFITSSALADITEELKDLILTGDLNGHIVEDNKFDFTRGSKTAKKVVPRGSKGQVLEVKQLKKTKSFAVKIRISSVGGNRGRTTAKVNDEVWVYYSTQKGRRPWVKFKDEIGQTVQDPAVGLIAHAQRDGDALAIPGVVAHPELPTVEEIIENSEPEKSEVTVDPNLAKNSDRKSTEGAFCPTCPELASPRTLQSTKTEALNIVSLTNRVVDPNNPWSNDPEIMNYSNSAQTQKMIKHAMNNKSRRPTGYCYRFVKRSLVASGVVSKYPPGGHARDGVKDLKAQGMKNLLDDPKYKNKIKSYRDVPKGMIIVAHNGTSASGDIVVKTDWGAMGGYVSDFFTPNPYTEGSPKARRAARAGKPYKITGVMYKP